MSSTSRIPAPLRMRCVSRSSPSRAPTSRHWRSIFLRPTRSTRCSTCIGARRSCRFQSRIQAETIGGGSGPGDGLEAVLHSPGVTLAFLELFLGVAEVHPNGFERHPEGVELLPQAS